MQKPENPQEAPAMIEVRDAIDGSRVFSAERVEKLACRSILKVANRLS